MSAGRQGTAKRCGAAKGARPSARKSGVEQHRRAAVVGDNEVGQAVVVDVGHRHGVWSPYDGEYLLGPKESVAEPGAVVLSITDKLLLEM